MKSCKFCGSSDTYLDEGRGETYCMQCGTVLEENQIVESLSFMETSNGSIKTLGQFIPSSKFSSSFLSSYSSRGFREFILQKGYNNIKRIADKLKLPIQLSEAAQRIYLMGVQRGFAVGRINNHVAAACLYISCRRNKSPQLLIDFSDVLVTPVKTLGKIFVKLLKVLHIHIPTVDPSLFMERFASQMDLKEKTYTVAQTGIRLIQAMMRDWICTGRRPTGLCGAALLIAARFHGFKINSDDVANVIRMSSSTVSKRLSEFKKTSAAQVKASEFDIIDISNLPVLNGPPCTQKKKKKIIEPFVKSRSDHLELSQQHLTQYLSTYPSYSIKLQATSDEICEPTPSSYEISSLACKLVGAIENELDSESIDSCKDQLLDNSDASRQSFSLSQEQISNIDPIRELLENVRSKAVELLGDDFVTPNKLYNENDDNISCDSTKACSQFDSLSEIEAYSRSSKDLNSESECSHRFEDEETLSDISDTEIESLILTEEEKKVKMLLWDELMKDVMPQVHRRYSEQKSKSDIPTNSIKRIKRESKNISYLETGEYSKSTIDSVRHMIESKNLPVSKHIKDDALNSLFSSPTYEQINNLNCLQSSQQNYTESSNNYLTSLFTEIL